ncbi:RNA polymerase sigma-54 factor [Alloacidobacterium dinghuense]|uniref:RNA polymerase sigma-54 factor n=1 Tax=Alloacidobacterium dinghuense TaxID=2763107 RepID=A0A7G8BP19_9BACT|nr:RNA polymerase sigma-54 factor [Alloacidobacterium dinghuense]QNI34289.1 RNA polymerase sigma-54 factor [Alloacidobacterium dinghuense]
MALLQPKLSLKVSQRQILTPGLMQMVSVLALNKLELKEMIQTEIAENPILEELEENVPLLDDVAGRQEMLDRPVEAQQADAAREKTDPFDEIDFGSYFQDYLDPGFRTPNSFEVTEKPSIENFLSQPSTLTDHLFWQLGSLSLAPVIRDAAEYIIGNLNEDGYLTATDEELLEGYLREQLVPEQENGHSVQDSAPIQVADVPAALTERAKGHLAAALKVVQHLDPVGVATRDLRECLLVQIEAQQHEFELIYERQKRSPSINGVSEIDAAESLLSEEPANEAAEAHVNGLSKDVNGPAHRMSIFEAARCIVDKHLSLLQRRDPREVSKAVSRSPDEVQQAIEFIRTLDPRPGQRYNRADARLIEPDVAFVKRGDEYVVVMNEEDLPTLRLNQGYRRMITQDGTEKEVKDYVKERYRSAIQLMRNIEQRKNTILRTCEAIIRRQVDFMEKGVDAMKPMMIKEVAEEIGVHPSTVSRAVSNKYVHTPQGVYELRFFFSEGVNGPEGSSTPLMLLKRKVKKLIEDEDPRKPLTDDLIASMLQSQGIDVTRRTVAKYREDMRIPSTHQRRVRG